MVIDFCHVYVVARWCDRHRYVSITRGILMSYQASLPTRRDRMTWVSPGVWEGKKDRYKMVEKERQSEREREGGREEERERERVMNERRRRKREKERGWERGRRYPRVFDEGSGVVPREKKSKKLIEFYRVPVYVVCSIRGFRGRTRVYLEFPGAAGVLTPALSMWRCYKWELNRTHHQRHCHRRRPSTPFQGYRPRQIYSPDTIRAETRFVNSFRTLTGITLALD